jgi:hypothetical protein
MMKRSRAMALWVSGLLGVGGSPLACSGGSQTPESTNPSDASENDATKGAGNSSGSNWVHCYLTPAQGAWSCNTVASSSCHAGGSVQPVASCPTANLIGCCRLPNSLVPGGYQESCFYNESAGQVDAMTFMQNCGQSGGMWSTTP